jgi:DNA-binding beta-propeller fold protein YncE
VLAGGGSYYLLGNNSVSGLAAPGCSTSVARAPTLSKVVSDRVTVGGQPFAVRETPDGRHTFVTVGDGIAVLRNDGGLAPTLLRRIHIAKADNGLWITGDGRYLLAAGGHGAVVISVAAAEQGAADPVVGRLESPRGNGAVGVVTSPDGSYAFVTLQNTTSMAVFNLGKALSSGFGQADFVGYVPLGVQPVGVTSSPDGKWLYVTSLQRFPGPMPAEGTLSVVSMQRAERAPAKAVVSTVNAGCSPARVITDGSTVWVTARDSNTLIGYSASRLRSDPAGSIVAEVKVGMAPIGLTFAAGHSRIVVADSDLNATPGRDPGLAVVSTAAALAGKDALLGTIPAGVMPRQLTLAARGKTLLVTDEGSGQLQAANLRHLR